MQLLLLCVVGAVPDLWAWNSGSDDAAIAQIEANKDLLSDVSFGAGYGIKCDTSNSSACTFSANNASFPTAKDAQLAAWGIRRHPLIGCGSTATLRRLFADPTTFIAGAVKEAVRRGLDGLNLDFEPYDGAATNADGAAYGTFLTAFADALHAALPGARLSVDFFSNNAIWSLAALNSSSADVLVSMDTYAKGNQTFEAYHSVALGHIDPARLGVGMCVGTSAAHTPYGPDPCPADPWTAAELAERFGYMDGAVSGGQLKQINLWVLPLPDAWWAQLRASYTKWRDD